MRFDLSDLGLMTCDVSDPARFKFAAPQILSPPQTVILSPRLKLSS
jgi:hypothetical protein